MSKRTGITFRFSRFTRNSNGTAAIEFAILVPVLALIMAGIINFGYAFYVKHAMTNVANDTIRTIVFGTATQREAIISAYDQLKDLHGNYRIAIRENPSNAQVSVTMTADANSATLIPFPNVSYDNFFKDLSVEVVSTRIARFDPSIN